MTPVSPAATGGRDGARAAEFFGLSVTPVTRRAACGLALGLLAPRAARGAGFDAVVGTTHASVASAIAAAPAGDRPWRILLERGRWNEKIVVRRSNVALIGADRRGTILSAATAAGHARPGGGNWGTYGSATLTVEARGFSARDLTIENGFDYVADMATGASGGGQAVALALGAGADGAQIVRTDIIGHQDSFYLREGSALIRDCVIAGSVDFIFGGAAAWFQNCELRSRLRPGESVQGYVAAPSTMREDPIGLVFDRCRLTREPGVPAGSVYLGRPWRAGGDTRRLGFAAFLECWMDRHIHPEGWTWMGYRGPGGASLRLEAGDARFYEHACRGPGARHRAGRRRLGTIDAARLRADLAQHWRTR